MNRVKVWAYAVLVAAVAVAALRMELLARRAEAIAAVDARLSAGAALVGARARALAREASAAAAAAARDAALVAALEVREEPKAALLPRKRPKAAAAADDEAREAALRGAARAALASAEETFGFALPEGTVITAGNREWLARKGDASVAEGEAMAYLRGAIGGKAARGWVRLNGAMFYAAASPAGAAAGVVVLVPLDAAWVEAAATAVGAEVTLSAPDVKAISTLRGDAAQPFAGWTLGADAGTDVGRLGPVEVAVGPVKVPRLPQPWGAPPAFRARAVALDGVKDGVLVLAVATAGPLGALASSHYVALAAVLGLLLVGVAVGFLVRAAAVPAPIPEALLAAAARIERGDFAARAPVLAGRLGTVSAALNKAADLGAALAAASAPGVSTTGMTGIEPFAARPLAPEPPAPPEPAAEPAAPAPAPAVPAAAPAALLQAAARAAAPATVEVDEEAHWQQVFQDFLRTRASCGEATEGLTYEKFRLKLDGNKAALVSKYACRSVKFQVYVKEGKAALKATPVK